jgi:hypothetical protein
MNFREAFELFEKMIFAAEAELHTFTKNQALSAEHKADKSVVTVKEPTFRGQSRLKGTTEIKFLLNRLPNPCACR